MLNVSDLSVSYGLHRALAGVYLNVSPGEIVVLLGANGCRKKYAAAHYLRRVRGDMPKAGLN